MKKNSTHFLLIGSGRLSRHLEFYFSQLGFSFSNWNRKQSLEALHKLISQSTHIFLAISDTSLESFAKEHLIRPDYQEKVIVHFSGALNISGLISAHPMMSFGPHFYELKDYEKIHFVITGADRLQLAIPGLKNAFTVISPEHKAHYHALCVLGGNFPMLLWQQMSEGLEKMGIPGEAKRIYLEKITENFNRHGIKALTGPLVRKDTETIQKNLKALDGHSFKNVYAAFVEAYK